MPVRKIPKNYRNVTGILASSKAGGSAQYESTLERDFLSILDFMPEVKNFDPQPVKVKWEDANNRSRSYTPDVLVQFVETERAPILYEVKYRSDLSENWSELRPKFKAAIHFAKQKGWRFKLMTELEIRTPYLVNIQFLARFRRSAFSMESQQEILGHLNGHGTITVQELLNNLRHSKNGQAEILGVLWYLIATFQIKVNLEQALNVNSQVWICRE